MRAIVFLMVVCLGVSFSVAAQQATWYVDGSVAVSGNGQTWETAFKKIQTGIDASSHGDTIIVAKGTYVENIRFRGKNIILRSTDPLNPGVVASTVIDGQQGNSVVDFSGTENETCTLSGFTIRNGDAWWEPDMPGGGGGIHGNGTHAAIENNVITGNSAFFEWGMGGAVYWCDGTIQNNTISGNSAEWGGGLASCRGVIQNNAISGNEAWYGSGLCGCYGTIQNNVISGNLTGGGLYECGGTIQNNVISGNLGGRA